MIKNNIFKAYDIRGVYPAEINEEVAFKIGASLAKFLKKKLKKNNLRIVVGRDCRLSSPSLFQALCQGIFREKATVIDIGLVSADTLYFALSYFKYDGGAMITASHNPREYNGFKMQIRGQKFIHQEWGMEEIKKLVNKTKLSKKEIKGKIIKKNVIPFYVKHILKLIDLKNIKKLKAVVDAGNGMGGRNIKEIAKKIPITLFPLYFKPDGNFPFRHPDPIIKKNLKDCQKMVIKRKANFGLAFDADADRTIFFDERGEIIRGDMIIALFSQYFLKKYPGAKIVYNLICSRALEEIIKEAGGYPLKVRTGHVFIKEKMLKKKAVFGGEKSGHLFFPDVFYSECGGLVFLIMIKILSETGKTLSELIKPFNRYYQININLKIKNKEKIIKKLKSFYQKEKRNQVDGLTIKSNDWWFNVRPSNTEPCLRFVIEAKNKKIAQKEFKQIKEIVKKV
jgi:phosphomannomutase